jgi:hypothetical protein
MHLYDPTLKMNEGSDDAENLHLIFITIILTAVQAHACFLSSLHFQNEAVGLHRAAAGRLAVHVTRAKLKLDSQFAVHHCLKKKNNLTLTVKLIQFDNLII